jgi:hypothetical protein
MVVGGATASAVAAPGDVGVAGHSYAPAADPPTGSKPESKLWFNGGWWAIMVDPATKAQHIFRLDRAGQVWVDTGVAADPRPTAHADALWDAASGKLYVASHDFTEYPARPTTNGARLWRFSYDPGAGTYRPDPGFPVTLNDAKTETVVIAKDSKGKLWATWVAGLQVWVTHTTSSDAAWTAPQALPVPGATVAIDDISSVVAFGGNRIGVLWSNQADGTYRFAVHADGKGDKAANWTAAALPGGVAPDDHINVKADGAGRVYAAVKHTVGSPGTAPLISLFARDTAGAWSRTTVGYLSDSNTRPIVLLDQQRQEIHVVATGPTPPSANGQQGGTIYDRTSPLGAISFAPGPGLPVIRAASGGSLNDVSSTKQNLDATTGIVVIASNTPTASYWHADLSAAAPAPPPPPPPPPPPAPAPPPPVKPRPVRLDARIARVKTARALARLYGRSWTAGKRRSLRCVRRTGRARGHRRARTVIRKNLTYDCRVSWRSRHRGRHYRGRSTVVRQGRRITTRIRVQTIRP